MAESDESPGRAGIGREEHWTERPRLCDDEFRAGYFKRFGLGPPKRPG